ncbi:MAG: hypothetical protein HYV63_27380 [Candidatus Schekmanbacteria bacterium]|nr:hypothetical protein [Candidatus Schekmanbacteria bacterium]
MQVMPGDPRAPRPAAASTRPAEGARGAEATGKRKRQDAIITRLQGEIQRRLDAGDVLGAYQLVKKLDSKLNKDQKPKEIAPFIISDGDASDLPVAFDDQEIRVSETYEPPVPPSTVVRPEPPRRPMLASAPEPKAGRAASPTAVDRPRLRIPARTAILTRENLRAVFRQARGKIGAGEYVLMFVVLAAATGLLLSPRGNVPGTPAKRGAPAEVRAASADGLKPNAATDTPASADRPWRNYGEEAAARAAAKREAGIRAGEEAELATPDLVPRVRATTPMKTGARPESLTQEDEEAATAPWDESAGDEPPPVLSPPR